MKTPTDIKPLQLIKALERLGFADYKGHGSHLRLKHPDGRWTQVAVHPGTVPMPTFKKILKETKLALPDLLDNLR